MEELEAYGMSIDPSCLLPGDSDIFLLHISMPWVASFLALATLTLSVTPAFAAACNPATPLDASGDSASCDMSISALVNPGVLTLTNDAAAIVSGGPFTLAGAAIGVSFSFISLVKDHRGSTADWSLSAASAGLINESTTIPLNLTAKDAASTCTNGTCPATTFTALTSLTTTPQVLLTVGVATGGPVLDGDYSNKTNGTFIIPAGSPSGTYSGTITITLANVF
ncbi:MAG: hypothetical protein H0U76_05095 [Ktedonobacteraceae bacterium]|nr:hypothetical protein [Ktedonobacteraceae bacterium]